MCIRDSFVRSNGCIVCGSFGVDADHLKARGMGGSGVKGRTHSGTLQDFSCVPLCRMHHTERHSLSNRDFEDKYRVNLWEEAFSLVRDFMYDEFIE